MSSAKERKVAEILSTVITDPDINKDIIADRILTTTEGSAKR